MLDNTIQYHAEEDGGTYFWDLDKKKFRKIYDVLSYDDLPQSVRKQMRTDLEKGGIMGKRILQIRALEDGHIYLYDVDEKTLQKLCDIEPTAALPKSVSETLAAADLPVKGRM
jgi:hypothetical protein